jgi:hypothetical protein
MIRSSIPRLLVRPAQITKEATTSRTAVRTLRTKVIQASYRFLKAVGGSEVQGLSGECQSARTGQTQAYRAGVGGSKIHALAGDLGENP